MTNLGSSGGFKDPLVPFLVALMVKYTKMEFFVISIHSGGLLFFFICTLKVWFSGGRGTSKLQSDDSMYGTILNKTNLLLDKLFPLGFKEYLFRINNYSFELTNHIKLIR